MGIQHRSSQYAGKPGQTELGGEHPTGEENPTAQMQVSSDPQSLGSVVPLKSGEARPMLYASVLK